MTQELTTTPQSVPDRLLEVFMSQPLLLDMVTGSKTDPRAFIRSDRRVLSVLPSGLSAEEVGYISAETFSLIYETHPHPDSYKAEKEGRAVAARVISWLGEISCVTNDLTTAKSAAKELKHIGGWSNRSASRKLNRKVKHIQNYGQQYPVY